MKRVIYLAAFAVILFAGCAESDIDGSGGSSSDALRLRGAIESSTRVDGQSWEGDEVVGVTIYNSTTNALIGGENVAYGPTAAGTDPYLVPTADDADPIYFPTVDNIDVVAYYPRTNSVDDASQAGLYDEENDCLKFGDQEDAQDHHELLWAKAEGVVEGSGDVDLGFNYMISKVRFTIVIADDGSVGEISDPTNDISFSLSNYVRSADFDLRTGQFTRFGEISDALKSFINSEAESSAAHDYEIEDIVLIPQTATLNVVCNVTTEDRNEYQFTQTIAQREYEAGHIYNFKLTLSREGLTLVDELPTITEWDERDEVELTPTTP